jgi:hypothetical protein
MAKEYLPLVKKNARLGEEVVNIYPQYFGDGAGGVE